MKTRVLLVAALLFTARTARAQNTDPFFHGDEAALGAGAVVASGRDSGSLWYNPAGFAGLHRGYLSASASTFGIRSRSIPDALRVRIGGSTRGVDLSSTDVISVPNAVVGALQLTDKIAIAGGILTPQRDVRSALATVPPASAVAADGTKIQALDERVDLQVDASEYHVGGALAAELSPDLRLGFALFGTYVKVTSNTQYSFNVTNGPNATDEHAFVAASERVTVSAFGIGASVGAQYRASDLVTLGLTVRTPEIALTSSSDGGGTLAIASVGGTDPPAAALTETPAPGLKATGKLYAPARVLSGVAFAFGRGPAEAKPPGVIEIGLDVAHGLPSSSIQVALRPTVNGRIGIRYALSPQWVVGGGLFSDRATQRNIGTSLASDKIDYYGFTAGVSKRTPLALVTDPSPEALVLVTTFSLRASAGFGQARALAIDLDASDTPTNSLSRVTYYELMPYLGSSVAF